MRIYKPFLMGLFMGPMMLWMLHGQLVNGGQVGAALGLFIGAHLALAGAVIMLGYIATRRSFKLSQKLNRFHHPSPRHIGMMLCGAVFAATCFHVAIHWTL